MIINKVKINNFYSFKESEIDFSRYNGIVKLIGINKDSGGSNGAGKSSIFEAIIWGIFGKTIRKSTEDALVNSKFGSGCYVEVTIEKELHGTIVITRSKRPTSLVLKKNGQIINKENATETQKYIEEILETDYKSFLAAIVFGQHSDYSFLDSSPEEKRVIIRNCFNLDDLFSKRESVKNLKSGFTSEQKVYSTLLKSITEEKIEVEKRLPNNKYKLIDLPALESILSAEKQISDLKTTISNLNSESSKNKKEVQKLAQSINKGIYKDTSECPICKSDYTVQQDEDELKSLIAKKQNLLAAQEDINFKVQDLLNQIESLKPEYTSSEWAKYNEKNKNILEAQTHINKFNEIVKKKEEYELKLSELDKNIEIMKFWEKAFSEQGMIKYIIRNILEYFNLKCNHYVSILTNSQFTIQFNDELIETIKNNNRETKYISLSGGEKRKVNLAIMLSLQDLSSKISKTNCNLIFFDEVCDNIDDLGIEAIYNLLNILRNEHPNKLLLLITHNNYLQGLLSETKNITVVKEKGISRIV